MAWSSGPTCRPDTEREAAELLKFERVVQLHSLLFATAVHFLSHFKKIIGEFKVWKTGGNS